MLTDQISKCQLCPLSANIPYGCSPMIGIGNINSKIVIVVPHPKIDNILIQSPVEFTYKFYVEKLLSQIGIAEKDYYITCVVKCPTENTAPKSDEIKKCSSFLLQETSGRVVIGCGEAVCKILKKYKIDHVAVPSLNKLLQSSSLKEKQVLNDIKAKIIK